MDAQTILMHTSIQTTGDAYQQPMKKASFQAINARTAAIFDGWIAPTRGLGLKARSQGVRKQFGEAGTENACR
jgi:hypothetical protein